MDLKIPNKCIKNSINSNHFYSNFGRIYSRIPKNYDRIIIEYCLNEYLELIEIILKKIVMNVL